MEDPTKLELTPSEPLLDRVKINFNSLFRATGKILVNTAFQNWNKLAESLVDLAASVGLSSATSNRAFDLIFHSICRATRDTFLEYSKEFRWKVRAEPNIEENGVPKDNIWNRFRESILSESIYSDFLLNPDSHPVLNSFQGLLSHWLTKRGHSNSEIELYKKVLAEKFVCELWKEWDKNKEFYLPIWDRFRSNPFTNWFDNRRIQGEDCGEGGCKL